MITNFQYITNPTSNIGAEIWQTANDKLILSDFKIVRKRDEVDLLIIRTTIDAEILFYCTDFDLLVDFAMSRTPIKCRFTENVCAETKVHNGFLFFNNKIDYKTKCLKTSIYLIDKYSQIIDGVAVNPNGTNQYYNSGKKIDDKIQDYYNGLIPNVLGSFWSETQKIYTTLVDGINKAGMSTKVVKLSDFFRNTFAALTINGYVPTYYNYSYIDNIQNLYICNSNDYYNEFSFETPIIPRTNEIDINFSIKDLLDVLRGNLFIYWYLNDSNTIVFSKFAQYQFNQGVSITENIGEQNIEIFEPEFSTLKYDFFESNEFKNPFSTKILKFSNFANSEKTIKSNAIFNINDATGNGTFLLLDVNTVGSSFNYNQFTSVFDFSQNETTNELESGTSLQGDWSNVRILNNSISDIYVFSKWFPINPQSEKINAHFFLSGDPNYLTNVSFFIQTPNTITLYGVVNGQNNFSNIASAFTDKWFRVGYKITDNTPVTYTFLNLSVENIGSLTNIKSIKSGIHPDFSQLINNYYLSPYYQIYKTNKICNMPDTLTNDGLVCHRKNIYQQEITYNYTDLIDVIDFDDEIKTTFGYLRLDKIIRKYDKNKFSICNLTLTGK